MRRSGQRGPGPLEDARFPKDMTHNAPHTHFFGRAALALILAGFAVRLWLAGSGALDLVQDEAQYWDWTRHLQLTYYSKGPLIAWIIAFFTKIFGDTELGVRFGSVLGLTLTQGMLYYALARLWKRPSLAFWSIFVLNTMPLFMGIGVLMTTDNPFTLCWTGAMFSLWRASLPADPSAKPDRDAVPALPFTLLALFFGVGILAKYTMLGFAGLAAAYGFLLDRRGLLPRGFWTRLGVSLAAGLALGFLPTLIWNVQNGFVGYKHVLFLIGVEGRGAQTLLRLDRFPEYLGSQLGLATPWWLLFMLAAGWRALKRGFGLPALSTDPAQDMDVRQSLLLSLFFWPMWLFFLAWSLHTKVLPNWNTVSYVAGAVLAASCMDGLAVRLARPGLRKAVVALSLALFLAQPALPVLPLPDHLNPLNRLKGWTDLGRRLDEIRHEGFADPDRVFLFSEVYDLTAALAFYAPGKPRTYCAWIDDRRMNQYDLWPGPQPLKGHDALFVVKGFSGSAPRRVAEMFASVGPPIHVQTTHNGQAARKFTVFACHGYNGLWPTQPTGLY